MRRKLRYHSLARRDFVGIATWSQAKWGSASTRRYLDMIEAQIQRIAENPMVGSDAEMPREGLRKITAGRHTIFYISDDREIQIVRILGQQQDHWNVLGLR